jgi:hypothetical protein
MPCVRGVSQPRLSEGRSLAQTGHAAHVQTRAERLAFTGKHDSTQTWHLGQLPARVDQCVEHRLVQRVHLVGAIQADFGHASSMVTTIRWGCQQSFQGFSLIQHVAAVASRISVTGFQGAPNMAPQTKNPVGHAPRVHSAGL